MADDKKAPSGGGGWEWGAFEIILGILLVIALIDRIQGNKTALKESPTLAPKTTITNAIDPMCGLLIAHPKSLEKVGSFITLDGSVTGCHWVPTKEVALYAQVIDNRGMPISEYVVVQPIQGVAGSSFFSEKIILTSIPSTNNGYLILIPAQQNPEKPVTVRIPIQFQK